MNIRPGARARVIAVAGLAALAWCAVGSATIGGDPMIAAEAVGVVALVAWAAMLGQRVWLGRRLADELTSVSRPAASAGIAYRLVDLPSSDALVVGTIRPTIFLGRDLLARLDEAELRAVLLHEEHHRRTRAPIRAAALEAWLAIVRPVGRLRAIVAGRLTDLEILADGFALAHGIEPAVLASALVKGAGRPAVGSAFATAADARVAVLLDVAAGRPSRWAGRLPYEWLPLAVGAIVVVACHGSGLTPTL